MGAPVLDEKYVLLGQRFALYVRAAYNPLRRVIQTIGSQGTTRDCEPFGFSCTTIQEMACSVFICSRARCPSCCCVMLRYLPTSHAGSESSFSTTALVDAISAPDVIAKVMEKVMLGMGRETSAPDAPPPPV